MAKDMDKDTIMGVERITYDRVEVIKHSKNQ